MVDGRKKEMVLNVDLLIPELSCNLISWRCCHANNVRVTFDLKEDGSGACIAVQVPSGQNIFNGINY